MDRSEEICRNMCSGLFELSDMHACVVLTHHCRK